MNKIIDFDRIKLENSIFFTGKDIYDTKTIEYVSETEIQSQVYDYMRDIVSIMNMVSFIKCIQAASALAADTLSTIEDSDSCVILRIPDLMVIKTKQNQSILVIEVKMPTDKKSKNNVLDDKNVLGQIYNYMLNIKMFYNKKKVYGILTTLEEWKFVWLPKKADINPEDRKMYESRIYKFSDPDLSKIIITIIHKSLESTYYPINIFDVKRSHIEYTEENWRWKRFTQTQIDKLLKNINLNILKSYVHVDYTLIKYFDSGKESQASLVISNRGSIGVLKQYLGTNIESFENEGQIWHAIYNIKTSIKNFNSRPSLVLPLAFTVETRYNDIYKTNEVFFQTNLKKILTHTGAFCGNLPAELTVLQLLINEFSKNLNVYTSAIEAIKNFSEKGYIHNDIQWRHIALLPVFKKDKIYKLKPILIDLENITKEDDSKIAYNAMLENIERLSDGATFIYVDPNIS